MDIVHSLQTKLEHQDGRHDDAFIVSAITVLCIADKTITLGQLSEEDCVQMSDLLRESYRPGREQKLCSAYFYLEQHLPTSEFRYNETTWVHVTSYLKSYSCLQSLCLCYIEKMWSCVP